MANSYSASVSFNCPTLVGREREYIAEVLDGRHASGNGPFTGRVQAQLRDLLHGGHVLLTTSCSSALEMAAILAEVEPGDEVILPSYTFTSTANAIVLRGATPVFVDIRRDTFNLDETLVEAAITARTKAVMVVHYAGVGCEMDTIMAIARKHGLKVIEDAAQALCATWRDEPLGRHGDLSAFSFHETKNIICGEGGALVVNEPCFVDRSEIIWEKGTNRVQFKRGQVSKYNWVDIGGSYLPGELTAAFLLAQLEKAKEATTARLALWQRYSERLAHLEQDGLCVLPHPPAHCGHNGHIFYMLSPSAGEREAWLKALTARGVYAVSHYVPLHSAPAGRRYGRAVGNLAVTDDVASRLIRLPLHLRLTADEQDYVIAEIEKVARSGAASPIGWEPSRSV